MRVTGNYSASTNSRILPGSRTVSTNESIEVANTSSDGRALISLSPARICSPPQAAIRQPAAFLAHLIATAQALPQTRERRRVEPQAAIAIYAAALELTPVSAIRAVSLAM